jgi:hypothetical protein
MQRLECNNGRILQQFIANARSYPALEWEGAKLLNFLPCIFVCKEMQGREFSKLALFHPSPPSREEPDRNREK